MESLRRFGSALLQPAPHFGGVFDRTDDGNAEPAAIEDLADDDGDDESEDAGQEPAAATGGRHPGTEPSTVTNDNRGFRLP